MDKLRIDKWLWAARFYKTRSLAVEEIDKGRVRINDQQAKPAREVKVGDSVALRQGQALRTLVVRGISSQRGAAPVARQLYEETEESLRAREQAAELRRLNSDPASTLERGRPTKRDRRTLDKAQDKAWGSRWSASVGGSKER
jgi:ribosome-associated heat shock protein Hsp15